MIQPIKSVGRLSVWSGDHASIERRPDSTWRVIRTVKELSEKEDKNDKDKFDEFLLFTE